jgi:hypothetical protein
MYNNNILPEIDDESAAYAIFGSFFLSVTEDALLNLSNLNRGEMSI